MSVWIALLRGINVGGKNKIKMTELQHRLTSIGLVNVETYIQSGNIIFESDQGEQILRTTLQNEMERGFGISTAVMLRTAGELELLIQHCPFTPEERERVEALNCEGESLYVGLMAAIPAQHEAERLNQLKAEGEELQIRDREIYLLLPHSIRKSRLADSIQRLKTPCTVRNWKTMNKLSLMAKTKQIKGTK